MDALQAGLSLLEESGDLVRLEPERLSLEPPCQQPRSDHADREGRQERRREAGQLAQQALRERRLEEADRNHADDLALVEDRRFPSGRDAQRAALHADPRLAGEDRAGIFVDGLADERRVAHGAGEMAVFNEITFRRREDKVAAGDIDLTAAEVGAVKAFGN